MIKTVNQTIDSNVPSTLPKTQMKYQNNEASGKHKKEEPRVHVIVEFQDRERITLGVDEYSLAGEVRLVIYSVQGKSLSEHNSIENSFRQVLDDLTLSFTGGKVRFMPNFIQDNGVSSGFYSSTIVCPFEIIERTGTISVSQLAGLDLAERIYKCLMPALPDPLRYYLTFDVVDGSERWLQTLEEGTNPYVALSVEGGQPLVNNGVRAEAVVDYPFNEGDIVEYSWRIRIPTGFQNDAANGNRWYIMGQWHDKPVGGGEGTGNSPPLSFSFGEVSGANYLSFEYLGDTPDPADLIPVPFDTWVNIKVKVWWTQNPTGQAEVYVNDVLNQTETGQNMLNALSHYFKLGQYRHPDITTNNTVHIDDIRAETVGTFVY
jgi:hypothetical protein